MLQTRSNKLGLAGAELCPSTSALPLARENVWNWTGAPGMAKFQLLQGVRSEWRDKRKEKGLEKELWAGTGSCLAISAWLSFSAERN